VAGGILEGVFAGLVFITVALAAFAIGALIRSDDLRAAIRTLPFLALVTGNVVVVSLLGYLVSTVAPLDPGIETGLVLCAICAGGPLSLKMSQLCNADLAWTLSLTVTLLILNVATVPLWSMVLLGRSLTLGAGDLLVVLPLAILAPLSIGLWARRRTSRISVWSHHATRVSNITLVLAVVLGVLANVRDLMATLSVSGLVAAVTIVFLSGLIGWLLPHAADRRHASSLVTLNRATSVALLVVGRAYVDNAEVLAAVVVFGVIQTLIAAALSLSWRTADRRLALRS
jgi:BASS family bile acid:Na+ symporter